MELPTVKTLQKRAPRGKAYVTEEKWLVVEKFEEHKEVLLSKDGKVEINKRRNLIWNEVIPYIILIERKNI